MKKLLPLDTWKRKEHFDFFSKFDDPYFGISTEIDCTKAYQYCKANSISFFAYYLHQSLKAANAVEAFRYRIDGDQVFIYDETHASATIMRDDETFAFSFIPYNKDFTIFNTGLEKTITTVQQEPGLRLDKVDAAHKNLVHYSSIPWIKINGFSHARSFTIPDSSPKIVFGKMFTKGDRMFLPVVVHLHHALADGLHLSQHLELFQKAMNAQ